MALSLFWGEREVVEPTRHFFCTDVVGAQGGEESFGSGTAEGFLKVLCLSWASRGIPSLKQKANTCDSGDAHRSCALDGETRSFAWQKRRVAQG